MKHALILLSLLISIAARSQNWTAALPHVTSVTGTPSASGSWIRLNTTTGQPYQWNPNTVSWVIMPDGIDVITGSIPPAYTPSYQQSNFAINAVDSLYYYRSGAWRHLNPGGSGGGGATYTAGTGIAISGGNVISNTGDLSTTNEIQRLDTLSLSGNTLSASLLNDGVPASTVDLSSLTPSTETIQDIAGGMVSGNTETRIALTYDDAGGKINAVVEGNLSNYTNDAGFLTAEVDGLATNEGSLTVGAGSGTTSTIVSNTSGSTAVTISASTGLSISEAGSTITLTNSAPDQTVAITGGGINSVTGTYPNFTVTGTELDGDATNELQDLVNTSDATSHTVTLNLSGGSVQLVEGSNIGLATTGTTGNAIVTISATADGGITSLNGLTPTTQTFATGTAGTDFAINSATSTHTFNLPTASGSNRGALSSADWTTFNGKQAAGNYITDLTGDVTASGPGSAAATVTKINGTSLAGLATGILKNTTTTGVPSIAVAGDFPTLNQNTTGSAATLTTPREIYGNNFDGSADLTQIIASTYGGTGNGFAKFSGPTTAEKTFTLPDASAAILTDNAAVTAAQGGTGATTLTGLLQGNGTSAVTAITNSSTAGQTLRVTGASTYAWGALDLADADAVTGVLPYGNVGAPYKIYVANITQSGTSDPVATVLENTLGATPTWARSGVGVYTVTATGAWVTDKTALPDSRVFIGGEDNDEVAATRWIRTSADVLTMRVLKPSTALESNVDINSADQGFTVTIKVYN